jgi:dGTPase
MKLEYHSWDKTGGKLKGELQMAIVNGFYNDFDKETLSRRNSNDYRTVFQVDRDRILHSYAFRRLQGKTQVFKPGEYDFYRTRLTHTIEVAQIGRSICNFLLSCGTVLRSDFFIDPDLVEAICLAHDIGHPPFGHVGERTLNELMAQFGGFEANAQTIKLLTETIYTCSEPGRLKGMQPTRALLDGVFKYKQFRSDDPKKFMYDDQRIYLNFVFSGLVEIDKEWKSIECAIMDWADEVAYSVGDVVDGVRARIITIEKLERWQSPKRYEPMVTELIGVLRKDTLAKFAADKIGHFIVASQISDANGTPAAELTNRHRYRLKIDAERRLEERCLEGIASDLLFQSPEVQQLEFKAMKMLSALFDVLAKAYVFGENSDWRLLKKDIESRFDKANDQAQKARHLCDYVSGMSDEYAIRGYRRLFDSDFGSIVDLV